jgi:hypothetical protein
MAGIAWKIKAIDIIYVLKPTIEYQAKKPTYHMKVSIGKLALNTHFISHYFNLKIYFKHP